MSRITRAVSFNDLVGEDVKLRRYGDSERLRCLAVDYEVEPRGLLDRQIAAVGAFENLVHERSRATEEVREVLTVAHQPAGLRVFALGEHRWQAVPQRQVCDLAPLREENRIGGGDEMSEAASGTGH